MIIEDFIPFKGQHCETTATGSLLKQLGLELSEPMLFGLGEGLGFIFWNMKAMDFPFIGGRTKPGALTTNLVNHLNLEIEVKETASAKQAWQNIIDSINNGIAVGLQLDCYHLEYFSSKIHFAGHFLAMYGYDEKVSYLIDTQQQGEKVQTSLESLESARKEKGPMAAKNRSYTIKNTKKSYDLKHAIVAAVKNNAQDYLNPPIKNIGYKGILKTSDEIKVWFKRSKNIEMEFKTTAMLMEKAGTGGALFRNFYRDFLYECNDILKLSKIHDAYLRFSEIANQWSEISRLFDKAGDSQNFANIEQASKILVDLSNKEKTAMELLVSI